jgi:hypothetical protein
MGDLRRDVSLYTITPVQRCGLKSERNGRLVGRGAPTNRQKSQTAVSAHGKKISKGKENAQGMRQFMDTWRLTTIIVQILRIRLWK